MPLVEKMIDSRRREVYSSPKNPGDVVVLDNTPIAFQASHTNRESRRIMPRVMARIKTHNQILSEIRGENRIKVAILIGDGINDNPNVHLREETPVDEDGNRRVLVWYPDK